jgi:capsular polysaccharide transport system permease protein
MTTPLPSPKPAPNPGPGLAAAAAARPPVRPAGLRLRHHLVLISFVLFVILPPIGAALYLWNRAADQYASKMGFAVRAEEASSALDLLGGLTGISGSSSSSDTDILFEFIQSQKLVMDIDAELNLRAIWSKPPDDPVFALAPDAPLEDLVDYWNDMVRLSRGKGPGLLEVEVRAFDPADAHAIATLLFEKSATMINDLSAIAREDAIRYAREDLDEAVGRLKAAREAVTRFRNLNQIVTPEMDIQAQAGLLSSLLSQQAAALIEIDLLRETTRDNDPRLVQAMRRLEVIEARIAAERDKLGLGTEGQGSTAMADMVGEYERLVVDREFAQSAYISALASYDGALAEARRTSRYLAAYMQPTLAETAAYPRRLTILLIGTLFIFLAWSITVLVFYAIRDRR